MNNRIPISEYRKKARVSLENQWGINTWLVFLSIIFTSVIQNFFDGFSPFPEESMQQHLLSFLVDNLLLFAFNYALFYIALVVVRGGRPKSNLYFQFSKESILVRYLASI